MIQLIPHMRIILGVEPADFRKGIDGLAQICRGVLNSDPFSGYLFVFMNKRKTSIKMLNYDGQGFWMFQKRLSKGRFKWWPNKKDRVSVSLLMHELQLLMWNGDPGSVNTAPFWKKIPI